MTMLRYNTGKTPLSLIPTSFFEAIFNLAFERGNSMPTKLIWHVGQVLDFGAQKYSAHNWRKGGSWSSTLNSALRHTISLVEGNVIDKESGLAEVGHLGCNIAFLLEFATLGVGIDDTYKIPDYQFPMINGEPAPGLVWVFNNLLKFRDTGSIHELREAAYNLAVYVERMSIPTAAAPAAPPAPAPSTPAEVLVERAFELFREGGSVEQVAQMLGRTPATIQKLVDRSKISLPFSFPSFGHIARDRSVNITHH